MLPEKFQERMQKLLGEEYPAFLHSYEKERQKALRLNTIKAEKETFLQKLPFSVHKVEWAENGYYYADTDQPGKHVYHEAGLYYIQEPSAMAPAEFLDAKPGETVLDLCAAPGGKSTQIAAAMQGEGLLISNEIHPARAKILAENVERMGIKNTIVTNESPERLAEVFVEYFDRIMVDAPCSGEGMFRKNAIACEEWSQENVQLCADRQDGILDKAVSMLKPGGRLVYSTCTFAPEENEGSISRCIKRHSKMHIVKVDKKPGMSEGVADWTEHPAAQIENTIRLWPHKLDGEGHFVAVLEKDGLAAETIGYCKNGEEKGISQKECKEYTAFLQDFLKVKPQGIYVKFGEQLYLMPEHSPGLKGLKVVRPGLHLGTLKKNRFEPAHALALCLKPEEVRFEMPLTKESQEVYAYLNGQTMHYDGEKGWYLITVDGYSIGWGKLAAGMMKNHYPKGLRKNL